MMLPVELFTVLVFCATLIGGVAGYIVGSSFWRSEVRRLRSQLDDEQQLITGNEVYDPRREDWRNDVL